MAQFSMSAKPKGWRIITGFVTGFLLVTGTLGWPVFADLQSKKEWGVLWSIESRIRSQSGSDLEFMISGQRHLVGLRGVSGQRIWIMLDPRYAPFYKQRPPDEPYAVSSEDYVRILQSAAVDPTVRECLRSHIVSHTK